jgi:hypothetical protein
LFSPKPAGQHSPFLPTGPVVILMLMHLAIAAITYTALIKVAPARNEQGRPKPAGALQPGSPPVGDYFGRPGAGSCSPAATWSRARSSQRPTASNIAAAQTGPPDPPRTRLRHTQAEFPVRPNARHRYQNGRRVACLL